jgi:hypothetical protein
VHAPIGFVPALHLPFLALQAQAQTPSSLTPEQPQAFQNLPPEQQKAIMDAIAKSSGTTSQIEPASTTEETDKVHRGVDANGQRRQATTQVVGRTPGEAKAPEGPPRMGSQSTVLIAVELTKAPKTTPDQPPMELPEATKKLLEDRRAHVLAGNPYRLNEVGQLALPCLVSAYATILYQVAIAVAAVHSL